MHHHVAAPTNVHFSADNKIVQALTRDYEIAHHTLDPALLRPGLDRKILFPHPDRRQKRLIFQVMHHMDQVMLMGVVFVWVIFIVFVFFFL